MKTIVEMVFGSHLYGLETPTSDKDYKGIYLPHPREILLGTAKKSIDTSTGDKNSKNGVNDVDRQIYSLQSLLASHVMVTPWRLICFMQMIAN